MPWVKGQSGNPAGCPKRVNTLARMARTKTLEGEALIDFALRIVKGEEREKSIRFVKNDQGERVEVTVELPPSLEIRLEAAKWLADRGWGKATENINLNDESTRALEVATLASRQLEEGLGPLGEIQ